MRRTGESTAGSAGTSNQPPPSPAASLSLSGRSLRPDRPGYVTDCCVIGAELGFCRAVVGWEM